MKPSTPAVVLLSGGLDSATVLAVAQKEGFECHCLSFDYGQRHRIELDAACAVARMAGVVDHRVLAIDMRALGGSALTDDIDVPKTRDGSNGKSVPTSDSKIPVTYVPARNTVFLSLGLALAEVLGARDLFIGANSVDYSGYPDCRPEFLQAFESMAALATRAAVEDGFAVRVRAPLVAMSKAEIIRLGRDLGVDYALTTSCYDPADGSACGSCDACSIRAKGFAVAGVADPTRYFGESPG